MLTHAVSADIIILLDYLQIVLKHQIASAGDDYDKFRCLEELRITCVENLELVRAQTIANFCEN